MPCCAQQHGGVAVMSWIWTRLISITPAIRNGKPCIVGTRITVYDILEYLAGGMTEKEIVEDFPSIKPEHIKASLAFAARRERQLAA